jgi:nitroreductase
MNETIKSIKERRSVRKYTSKKISKDIIEELVDCARLAPSARNDQPWEFLVVTNEENLKKLSKIITYGSFLDGAAACIIVCGKEKGHLIEDGSAATENILVAAHSLGIGSCWIAGYNRQYNEDIKQLLNIPKENDLASIISLGYISEKANIPKKRSLKEVLHFEKF